MTNSETTVEEKIQERAEKTPRSMPEQRPLIPCEITILYIDKVNETIESLDIPQNMPNGLIQIPCGDEMIVLNPQQIRRFKVKAIKKDENRIIT